MSHFLYKLTLPGGKPKSGQVTGKTEEDARERLKKLYNFTSLLSIRPKPVASTQPKAAPLKSAAAPVSKTVPPTKVSPVLTKPLTAKATSKLEKLLYLQSNKCFFCGRVLTTAEASIEHIQPKSGGGNNADGNVVACCITLNRTFGSISLKEKIRIILDRAEKFTCPVT
jgi:5-methylcytosine-specific restriction endonuclease McrA